jgi:hypothetical protein
MMKERGRLRLLGTRILAAGCLLSAVAAVAQPSAATLEEQARAEFAKVGFAVRARLEREAAGDWIGARIAAQEADAHRYRFLDIKRELNRLHSAPPASPASPSVEAGRSPFLPDDSFSVPSAPLATQATATTVDRQEPVKSVAYADWDMYRPHEVRDRARRDAAEHSPGTGASRTELPERAGDMYSKKASRPISGRPDEETTEKLPDGLSSQELVRAPYLVYREPPAGRDPHE